MNRLPARILTPRLPPVTRIAVGSLTVSSMQANLPEDEGAAVLAYAFDSGINFVDTAQYTKIILSSAPHSDAAKIPTESCCPPKPMRGRKNSP